MNNSRPYRLFQTRLLRKVGLSPHMARLTFSGADVARMRTDAPDQRIKLFFPDAAGRPSALADTPDWYARYKAQDVRTRPPMRTYTIRALRPEAAELDIDFVLHGDGGPASRWALAAAPGEPLQIMAPAADFTGEVGGFEWKPPAQPGHVLLIADETALPALAGILEALAARPSPPPTQAFVEIPDHGDTLPLARWPGLALEWLPRHGQAHGAGMVAAAERAALPANATRQATPDRLADIDIEAQLPWERADSAAEGFYAWVAGESAAVMAIRRHLIQTRGVDRKRLNLMGYWRLGRAME